VANIKSQIKRNRQNEVRRLRNRKLRSELNTRTKSAVDAAADGSDDAPATLRDAISRIDKAAQKGVLPKRTAARRKSRLMREVAAASADQV